MLQVCKQRVQLATMVSLVGNIFMACAFTLIGPAPFMIEVMPNSIGLSYTVALLIGIGYALIMVSRQGNGKGPFLLC